jgi:hypothetical protein
LHEQDTLCEVAFAKHRLREFSRTLLQLTGILPSRERKMRRSLTLCGNDRC